MMRTVGQIEKKTQDRVTGSDNPSAFMHLWPFFIFQIPLSPAGR